MADLFNPFKKFIGSFLPNCLLECQELTPMDKLVWARLAQYAGENGSCFPKQKIIAEDLGSNKDTVSRSLQRLEKKKFIKVKRPTGKERWAHKGNEYFFINHKIFNDSIQSLPSRLKVDSTSRLKVDSFKKEENHKEENHKDIPQYLIKFVLNFHKLQKDNHPNILKKNLTKVQCIKQALIVSKLIRIDDHNFKDEIEPAILWGIEDSFWTSNLYSLATLRTKSKRNELTKFKNILSSYLDSNKSSKNKKNLTPRRRQAYKDWEKDED